MLVFHVQEEVYRVVEVVVAGQVQGHQEHAHRHQDHLQELHHVNKVWVELLHKA